MKILAFSDVHCDMGAVSNLVSESARADLVIGAGDFASVHNGLAETVAGLAVIECPVILVPGNNETDEALRQAVAGWTSATVLHGESAEVDGVSFFGIGAGIPTTPWDWSFDLSEDEARAKLEGCPDGGVLVLHSPPQGHCDTAGNGQSLGSEALLEAIERCRPEVAVCGHIHESWGCESQLGETRILNLGPAGTWIEL